MSGEQGSNLRLLVGNESSYHWTTPACVGAMRQLYFLKYPISLVFRQRQQQINYSTAVLFWDYNANHV